MSNGEMMIWAAAYVAARSEGLAHRPRFDTRGMTYEEYLGQHRKYEEICAASAVDYAHGAVEAAREALPHVREGWGDDHDVVESLLSMLRGT